MNPLDAVFRQDPTGSWTASVQEESVITHGETLALAHHRLLEALFLVRNDLADVVLQSKSRWEHRTDLAPDLITSQQHETDVMLSWLDASGLPSDIAEHPNSGARVVA